MSEVEDARERLFARCEPIPESGCWMVHGWLDPSGYGRMRIGKKQYTTHRAAYIMENGEPDPGLQVLHKCDNPACVNPSHLYAGTHKDNVRDRLERGPKTGGAYWGERNQIARLDKNRVAKIKRMLLDGNAQVQIAKAFGVSRGAIDGIARGINWYYVEPEEADQ